MAYDPLWHRIYGVTHPRGHFVYHGVANRRAVDKGRVNNFESICRTLGIDDKGNVYGSFREGQIFKYDPRISLQSFRCAYPFVKRAFLLGEITTSRRQLGE